MTAAPETYENMSDAGNRRGGRLAPRSRRRGGRRRPPPTTGCSKWNLSDLAFLRARARAHPGRGVGRGRDAPFPDRTGASAPDVTLVIESDLLCLSLRQTWPHQRTSVAVTGYDASARGHRTKRRGAKHQAEVSGGGPAPTSSRRASGHGSPCVREVPLTPARRGTGPGRDVSGGAEGFVQAVGTTKGTRYLAVGSPDHPGSGWVPLSRERRTTATRVRQTYDLVNG